MRIVKSWGERRLMRVRAVEARAVKVMALVGMEVWGLT